MTFEQAVEATAPNCHGQRVVVSVPTVDYVVCVGRSGAVLWVRKLAAVEPSGGSYASRPDGKWLKREDLPPSLSWRPG